MLSFLVFLTVLCTVVSQGDPSSNIIGGDPVEEGEITYIVSIRKNNKHKCGGSILDNLYILTAAHCVFDSTNNPGQLSIQYDVVRITNDLHNVIQVKTIAVHERFKNSGNFPNDIAVLKLQRRIPFNAYITEILLPMQNEPTPSNRYGNVAGWGVAYTGGSTVKDLQEVYLKVLCDSDCANRLSPYTVPRMHICAGVPEGGKSECSGDSGGPLMIDGIQYGIVSWSFKPCAEPGMPGVYTKVSSYVLWIYRQMGYDT